MKKRQGNLISGLDIGSKNVRMTVGQMVERPSGSGMDLQILGAVDYASEGVQKGKVNSIEDVVSSISACLERAERMVGVPIDNVWVGVSGMHTVLQNSKGVIAVSKANNEITEEDVNRALEAARSIATPLNHEVLHVLPRNYAVDGQFSIKDPVGMTGIRLEVDSNIVLGSSSQIKNLTKSIYRAGLEIDDLVLSVLACSEAVLTKKQKELGVAVINLGASTTSLIVFEEGEMLHATTIALGSENITNDLAIGLRTSVDVAEMVKTDFGDCRPEKVTQKDQVDLYEAGAGEHEIVKQKYINEIIQARVEEILQKVDTELRKTQRSGLLPAGVVFTGAGSKLPGLVDCAKRVLRLPAVLGHSLDITSVSDKVNDMGFSTAVGLVKWGALMQGGGYSSNPRWVFKGFNRAGGQLKKWFKTLVP
ncbi:MAG: cell division protein FtsA [bacterium]